MEIICGDLVRPYLAVGTHLLCSGKSLLQTTLRNTPALMEESLEQIYSRLSLGEEKKHSLDADDIQIQTSDISSSLVGKILAPRTIGIDQISTLFRKLWSPKGSLSCKTLHDNVVLFSFCDTIDKKKAQLGAPWLLDRYLMVLEEAREDMIISHYSFNISPFWIQLHDLPLGLMNKEFTKYAERHWFFFFFK
ncbi:hypothetical protein DH2020_011019 [Rehmannia glutinosa]|uniref:DUF4283 domain-containing protein n=1 Tax=Rehmannia glutinosa TaxID=99300 RepID=A0ABR0XCA8_REHGL